MSVKLVRGEISKFLQRAGPEVLCIRGRWGVGKTYAWSAALDHAQKASLIKFPRYSYVSLFGINSLDELKFAIFENVIALSGGLVNADLHTLDAFVSSKIGSWRKVTRLAQSMPLVRKVIGGDATSLVSFMTIRDQIICIDDLERRGSNLDVRDVLGLISYLREQRGCKVALILNDEKLDEEAKNAFGNNLEKVVDLSVAYEPTAADSVEIAITGRDATSQLIAERCQMLGITNIRVIRRIERALKELEPMLDEFHNEVFKAAVASVVLFGWANDAPDEAPSIEFLKTKTQELFGLKKPEEMPEHEAAWSALLEAYGYLWTDELDLELIRAIRAGHFDPDIVKQKAKVAHDKILAVQADGSFESAWRKYHDSFDSNDEEVLDGIHASFMNIAKYISPTNLGGTITLFKDLGRQEQAQEMLAHYMATRQEERAFYDLDEGPFRGSVEDPDVRNAFRERFEQLDEKRDIRSMLLNLKDGGNSEIISALAALPVDEYRKVLKSAQGDDLRQILSGLLQFDRIGNPTDPMREISSRARKALKEIGGESAINKWRVQRFGVKLDENDG